MTHTTSPELTWTEVAEKPPLRTPPFSPCLGRGADRWSGGERRRVWGYSVLCPSEEGWQVEGGRDSDRVVSIGGPATAEGALQIQEEDSGL